MFYSIHIQKLSKSRVCDLLNKAENSFVPPLSHNIPYTMEEYSQRLSDNAMFVLCDDNIDIIGFLAYYENIDGGFAYIPQIWVSDAYQRQGVGSFMIEKMITALSPEISTIRLEVRKNNEKAYSFYLKNNYILLAEKDGKCLLEKTILRTETAR